MTIRCVKCDQELKHESKVKKDCPMSVSGYHDKLEIKQ